jgi:hypothetical protein
MARFTSRRLLLAILLVPALSIGSAGIRASGASSPPILAQDTVWQFVAERPAGA